MSKFKTIMNVLSIVFGIGILAASIGLIFVSPERYERLYGVAGTVFSSLVVLFNIIELGSRREGEDE